MLADEQTYKEPHQILYYTLPFGKVSKAVKRYGKQVIEEQEENLNESLDGKHNNSSHLHKVDKVPGRQIIQERQTAWDERTTEILGMKCSHTVSIKKCQDGEKEVSVLELPSLSNDLPHPNKLFRRKRSANRPYQKEKENHGIESHLRQLKGKQARCVREDGPFGPKQHNIDKEWTGHSDKDENDSSQNAFGQSSPYVFGLINNSSVWMEGGSYIESRNEATSRYKPYSLWSNPSNFGAKEE
ncbi:hypothetical protein CHS0354_009291 [Potamilus streckersoni]|uniref:Uncharacterized protein n=1 Tax=Potamilus streckersoni TaxID=2493646 RepID=A0AAE0W905_9BIVA|nr:hypothetical protein CHS0354_009291 [Potamilus streckersoni]